MASAIAREPPTAAGQPTPWAEHLQHQPEGGGGATLEWPDRVRSAAREERARARVRETRACARRARGAQPGAGEARAGERVARQAQRPEDVLGERLPALGERRHQVAVGAGIGAEAGGRLLERVVQRDRAAVVERMRERDLGVRELEPVCAERQRAQERRGEREWMDGRAHVVPEPGQRQLGRPRAAADRPRRPRAPAPSGRPGRARSPRRARWGRSRPRSRRRMEAMLGKG